MSTRILLVEDEDHLARGLRFNLEAEGYSVELCDRGESALEHLSNGAGVELVLLDVLLPGISGIDVLRTLRSQGNEVSALLLTARDAEEDIVAGLDAGADDYLTKPFSLAVLLARVRTLLRRSAASAPEVASFQIGDCTVHPDRFEVERDGKRSPLTAKELGLLLLLQSRRGSAVSRGDILQEVWDLHPETRTRVVDTFMLRLRKLIEADPSQPRYLLSVRAFGYKLGDEDEPGSKEDP